MQIDRLEYIAVTNGLHAQIGIMTRLAKERRETIESLKRELQYRDNILTEVRNQSKLAVDATVLALRDTEQTVQRMINILNGDDNQPPQEGEREAVSLAWAARQKIIRKCKRGACCRK